MNANHCNCALYLFIVHPYGPKRLLSSFVYLLNINLRKKSSIAIYLNKI
ncbi:hypothetical protein SPHINGO8BC_150763 [Sphingobacterium multivorum]|uniref:Uncharacterized protein n=1 Tax=Sphingobacterium multivorum TaxID=28454 RepID=A0A654B2L2_SPHMU|nr:hypothetical protein SPHINGO8BC_150763 [Sphingobacterium multivorum]